MRMKYSYESSHPDFFVTFMVKVDWFVELISNRALQPFRHEVARDESFLKKSSYLRLFAEMHEDMPGIIGSDRLEDTPSTLKILTTFG